MSAEPNEAQVERELIEMLNELRVQLPGVQALFAFLLMVPFSTHFERLTALDRVFYFAGFLCAAISAAFLTAPSVYHRLHWRRDVRDKDEMLRTCNRLALIGSIFLALAMISTMFVLSDALFGLRFGVAITGGMTLLIGSLWYVLPLSRRTRDVKVDEDRHDRAR